MADDTDGAGLDPRFDPAFQRGFEGTVGTTRRRPPVGTPSVMPAQEIAAKPAVVEPVRPAAVGPVVESRVVEGPVVRTPEPEEEVATRRVNPFIVALVVIAIVLIVAGIWGAMFANSVFASDLTSSVSYVTVLLVIASSAVSVGVGVATLIGIVFLYAAKSLRR